VGDQGAAFVIEGFAHDLINRPFSRPRRLMEVADEFAAQQPQVVAMPAQRFAR
jgi:hypothetical protein